MTPKMVKAMVATKTLPSNAFTMELPATFISCRDVPYLSSVPIE